MPEPSPGRCTSSAPACSAPRSALACRGAGLDVLLSDISPENVRTASGLGAGRARTTGRPAAAGRRRRAARPPRRDRGPRAGRVGRRRHRRRAASRASPSREVAGPPAPTSAATSAATRWPAASAPARWPPAPPSSTAAPGRSPRTTRPTPRRWPWSRRWSRCAAASRCRLTPEEHDLAVARTSHLPHLLAALVAGRLADAPGDHLALSGQGVRDVTRIAAGDPALWEQIIVANAAGRARPCSTRCAAGSTSSDAAVGRRRPGAAVAGCSSEGVAGTLAIPGKHGGPLRPTASVFVAVPDHPGELARLFADAGEIGVNIEDVHIDHDPGRPVGLVELVVEVERAGHLADALGEREWTVHL